MPDTALSRACYVLRFLLSDRLDLRTSYYKSHGRVVVIGQQETVADIPEYGFVPSIGSVGAKGWGAIPVAPVSSGPEENILCYKNTQPRQMDDALIRSVSIGVLELGVRRVDMKIMELLEVAFHHAINSGRWMDTDAARSLQLYFVSVVLTGLVVTTTL